MTEYAFLNGKPVLEDSLVVFLDTLGTRAAAESGLAATQRRLEQLFAATRVAEKASDLEGLKDLRGHCIATFTDNIVIGVPIQNADVQGAYLALAPVVAVYELAATMNGLFLRGGMTRDFLWMNDRFVFGPGLNAAYELEHGTAFYPRVIVDENVRALGLAVEAAHQPAQTLPRLVVGHDGTAFLNYLDAADSFSGTREATLKQHRDSVVAALFDTKGLPGVREKFAWLRTYHNYFCTPLADDTLTIDPVPDEFEFFTAAEVKEAADGS